MHRTVLLGPRKILLPAARTFARKSVGASHPVAQNQAATTPDRAGFFDMRCAADALWVVPLFLFRFSLSLFYFVGTLATGVRAVSLCFIFILFVCVRVGDCVRLVSEGGGGCCCAACVVAVKAGTFRCRVLNNRFILFFSRMLTPAA